MQDGRRTCESMEELAELNGADPQALLTDTFARLPVHKITKARRPDALALAAVAVTLDAYHPCACFVSENGFVLLQ